MRRLAHQAAQWTPKPLGLPEEQEAQVPRGLLPAPEVLSRGGVATGKIYSDDPNLPYKTTKLSALHSRMKIDGVLGKWGVKDSAWRWDPAHNEVFVEFKFTETIGGVTVSPVVKVAAPAVWDHKTRNKVESINWNISLRTMYWFIKSHLETAYLTQSDKTTAFLPYISAGGEGQTLSKVIIANLEKIQSMPALPEFSEEKLKKVIETLPETESTV